MVNWFYFPKSHQAPDHLIKIVELFNQSLDEFDSTSLDFPSNYVLEKMTPSLQLEGYLVETSKKKEGKINVPVLFGENGRLEKSFDADAYNKITKTVIEIEAGRAVTNYQFLKDLFQACMMTEVDYLVLAVRKTYRSNNDYKTVITFLETLHASNRLQLPLKGILTIGY